MKAATRRTALTTIYEKLLARFGPQHWWPGETPFEMCLGAILTQNTAWTNVDRAIRNLKDAGVLDAAALRALPEDKLARLIKPSGYYNMKAKKLKVFVEWLGERCKDDLDALFSTETDPLRAELLGVHGIGEETADSMLLYAGGKPVFVIDAYTRRIFERLGLQPETGDRYGDWQRLFMDGLPPEAPLYNEYHALIVRLGKETCRSAPRCRDCPLNNGRTGSDYTCRPE
jgi:endonuclease-3 related protein